MSAVDDQARARKPRVSDGMVASDIEHIQHYRMGWGEDLLLPAAYVGDLRDARTEITDLRAKLAAAEARLTEAERAGMEGWQPVETAPTSYYILGFYHHVGNVYPDVIAITKRCSRYSDGFWQDWPLVVPPTHWRPLPPAPVRP